VAVVFALWIATLAFSVALMRGRVSAIMLNAFAAFHWGWEAVAYHAAYFSRINPAAWLFAGLFVIQALAFVWFAVLHRRVAFDWGRRPRHVLAGVFVVYSLLYPLFVVVSGHQFPRAPASAVPCPTALFTAGILFAAALPVPRWLFVVPIIWSIIGGSAALVLGMTPDLMLFVSAICLLIRVIAPTTLEGTPV
jgi:hypothetical protein